MYLFNEQNESMSAASVILSILLDIMICVQDQLYNLLDFLKNENVDHFVQNFKMMTAEH